jgi:hypothetical protein
MKLSEILLSGAVAAWALAAIVGAGGYYALKVASNPAQAEAETSVSWWEHASWSRRRMRHGAGGCSEEAKKHSLVALTPYIADDLKLSAAQKAAWSDLASKADQGVNGLRQSLCGEAATTAPEALAAMRRGLIEGERTLAAIEPDFIAFYGSLNATQKARIDGYVAHHRAAQ